ncbi:hypothetical protein [Halalkalibacter oceani]|uniref:hypothetical protein n=1 Tax=Halalkalibacter oceani TaxID=1653776 RepID=UPI003392AA45
MVKNVILGPILLLINLVTGDMESFKSNLSQIWDNIKNAAQTIWNALKDTVVTIITTLIDNAKLVWDTFKTYISTLWASILTIAQNIFNNIASAVRERTTQAKDTVTSIWGTVRSFFTEVLSNIWNTVQQKFQDIVNAVKQKMEEAKNNVVRGWNASVEFLRSIDLLQIGKDIIQGLINGITQKVEDVKNAVKNVTDAITGTVKSILQIHSPSRVAIGLTNDFGDGMVIGLEKSKDEVEKASGKLADSVWKPVTDATTRAITSIMQDAKKAGKAAKDGANRVKAEFDEAMKSSASRYELGQISTEQYVAALKAIEFEFAKTAEQRRKIAKELKDAEEKYVKETFDASMKFIERRKYFNQMTLEQELTSYERMIERYKAGSEEYEKLEREIYRVKKAVEEEKQKLEKEAFDKSKAWIDERKYYNEMSLADELAAWQRVHDTYINNIELRKQAERELYRVRQQMVEQIKKLDQDYYRRREEINNRLIAEEKRLRDEYQKTLDARTKSLVSFAGLFDEVTKKEEVSGQQLIENLRGQVTTFENWSRNIASLAKRGIDKGLLAELREMGPKAAAEIEALNGLTDAELAEYSNLFKQKNQLAQQQAESELEKMKSTTDRQIKQLRENTKIELDELRLEWSRQVSRIREGTTGEFTGMAEEMPDIGKSAMEGLKEGMASMEDELIATAKGIADKIAQTIRSAFNVPTPAPPSMPGGGGSGGGPVGGAISSAGKALTNRSPIGAVINAGKALSGLSSALTSSSNVTNQSTTNNNKTNNITINSPKVSTPAEREREIKRLDRALSMG